MSHRGDAMAFPLKGRDKRQDRGRERERETERERESHIALHVIQHGLLADGTPLGGTVAAAAAAATFAMLSHRQNGHCRCRRKAAE